MRRALLPTFLLLLAPLTACVGGSGDFCGDLGATLEKIRAQPARQTPTQREVYYEDVADGLDDMADSAPEDLADEVEIVQDTFAKAADTLEAVDWDQGKLEGGIVPAFGDERFGQAARALDAYAKDECDLDTGVSGDGSTSTSSPDADAPTSTTGAGGVGDGSTSTVPDDEEAPTTSTPPA